MIKKCLQCQKEYKVTPKRILTAKYCSYQCSGKASLVRYPKIQKECLGCHIIFHRSPSREITAKYCSKPCQNQALWKSLKGIIKSAEVRQRMSIAQKGKAHLKMRGVNHPNWKGGVTPENELQRIAFRRTMQKLIFERDGYKCQIDESTKDLQVDHIASWSEFKELRFDPENCRTLCAKCHYKITYGRNMPESVKTWGHNLTQKMSGGY